jgi:hypothetical protein
MGQVQDFAQFLNYKTIEVPVQYGFKTGKIYTFSHQDHLKNGLLKNYKDELQSLIEKKKYEDSEKSCCDIGPTVAVANLIEDGEYAEFVKKYNHDNLKLTGLEHILRVEEELNGENTSHLILPLDEDQDFANKEQEALMRYSTYFKRLVDPTKDLNQGVTEWVLENKNAEVFREEILKASRVYKIEGCQRIYSNCAIYKNLFREIINRYAINEKDCEDTQRIKIASEVFHEYARVS